jgi:hypothetical protein
MKRTLKSSLQLRYFVFFLLSLGSLGLVYGQREAVCTGTAQIELSRYETRVALEKKARDLAIINALENEFGTVIVQGNTTYLKTVQSGDDVNSSSSFNMIANSQVKGELVEVLDQSFTEVTGIKVIGGKSIEVTDLKCDIKIKGRELIITPIEFDAYPLVCQDPKCVRVDFTDGDELYFYFNTPVEGYLYIYLDDAQNVYCLLPYADMPSKYTGGFPVKTDQEYLFFANNGKFHGMEDMDFMVEQYNLTAESPQDFNRMYVVFSSVPLNKLKTDDEAKNLLTSEDLAAGFSVPRYTSTRDFQKWLAKSRGLNNNLQIKMIDITISEK